MHRFLIALIIAAMFVVPASAQTATPAPTPSSNDIGIRLLDEWLTTGTLPPSDFAPNVAEFFTSEKVKALPFALKMMLGDYKSVQRSFDPDPNAPHEGSRYILKFTSQTVDVYLQFDDSQRIDNFYMKAPDFGPTADQTSKYITPPAGWTKFTVPDGMKAFGVAEIFRAPNVPGAFGENINVVSVASDSTSMKTAMKKIQALSDLKISGVELEEKHCGRFQAAEITGKMSLPMGGDAVVHELAVLANLHLYMATYTRLATQAESTEAVAAVQSLCDSPLFGGVSLLLRR